MKICIPSKNRAETLTTHLFFKPEDVLIFVEPNEVKKYKVMNPDYEIVDIKTVNKGVSRVRNFILDYCNDEKIIIADDDIFNFGIRNNEYRYDITYDTSKIIEDINKNLDVYDAISLPNPGFAYFLNKTSNNVIRFIENKNYLAWFVCLNLEKIKNKIKYDEDISEFEDIDFTINLLINNKKIAVDYKYSIFSSQRTSGGLEKTRGLYFNDNDHNLRKGSEYLIQKYGFEFIKITHDEFGYLTHCSINTEMIKKRKEIIHKNLENYNKTHKR
jgi:hypothetical protein